jgi:two-component system C4-dicarboxylate transport response regulator DctD
VAAECSNARVLIVDDNTAYAQNLAEILELSGCPTDVCATAEEALPVALRPETTAVITDLRLPGMSGIELVSRIVRERGPLPTIVITAYADDAVFDAANTLGCECFAKPIDLGILERFLRHLASRA